MGVWECGRVGGWEGEGIISMYCYNEWRDAVFKICIRDCPQVMAKNLSERYQLLPQSKLYKFALGTATTD